MQAGYTRSAAEDLDLILIHSTVLLGVGFTQIIELIDVGGLRMVEFQRC